MDLDHDIDDRHVAVADKAEILSDNASRIQRAFTGGPPGGGGELAKRTSVMNLFLRRRDNVEIVHGHTHEMSVMSKFTKVAVRPRHWYSLAAVNLRGVALEIRLVTVAIGVAEKVEF